MTVSRKDLAATALTILVVLAFVVTHEGWDVPLIGDSHRWAAPVILLLGGLTCALGESDKTGRHKLAAALGIAALVLSVLALVTGSLTALSLLVADIVALWALATFGHVLGSRHRRALPA